MNPFRHSPAQFSGISETRLKMKSNRFKNKPWFDINCKNKRNEYFRIKNKLKKSKANDHRLKVESKKYKNFIRNTSRRYFKKFHADIRNLKTKDPKQFWNLISSKKSKQNSNNIPMQNLFDHFSSIGENNSDRTNFDPRDTDIPENDKINYLFTKAEILDVIWKLKKD